MKKFLTCTYHFLKSIFNYIFMILFFQTFLYFFYILAKSDQTIVKQHSSLICHFWFTHFRRIPSITRVAYLVTTILVTVAKKEQSNSYWVETACSFIDPLVSANIFFFADSWWSLPNADKEINMISTQRTGITTTYLHVRCGAR